MSPLELRMAHLEGAYEQTSQRLAAIDLRFDNVDRRFDAVDRNIDERFMWTIGVILTCWFTTMLGIAGILVKH